jgi:hypothetical protein
MAAIGISKTTRQMAGILYAAIKGKADEWVRQWQLPPREARDLYLSLAAFYKVRAPR